MDSAADRAYPISPRKRWEEADPSRARPQFASLREAAKASCPQLWGRVLEIIGLCWVDADGDEDDETETSETEQEEDVEVEMEIQATAEAAPRAQERVQDAEGKQVTSAKSKAEPQNIETMSGVAHGVQEIAEATNPDKTATASSTLDRNASKRLSSEIKSTKISPDKQGASETTPPTESAPALPGAAAKAEAAAVAKETVTAPAHPATPTQAPTQELAAPAPTASPSPSSSLPPTPTQPPTSTISPTATATATATPTTPPVSASTSAPAPKATAAATPTEPGVPKAGSQGKQGVVDPRLGGTPAPMVKEVGAKGPGKSAVDGFFKKKKNKKNKIGGVVNGAADEDEDDSNKEKEKVLMLRLHEHDGGGLVKADDVNVVQAQFGTFYYVVIRPAEVSPHDDPTLLYEVPKRLEPGVEIEVCQRKVVANELRLQLANGQGWVSELASPAVEPSLGGRPQVMRIASKGRGSSEIVRLSGPGPKRKRRRRIVKSALALLTTDEVTAPVEAGEIHGDDGRKPDLEVLGAKAHHPDLEPTLPIEIGSKSKDEPPARDEQEQHTKQAETDNILELKKQLQQLQEQLRAEEKAREEGKALLEEERRQRQQQQELLLLQHQQRQQQQQQKQQQQRRRL